MGISALARVPVDPRQSAQYVRRSLGGPCFACAILAGHPAYPHHDVYEDDHDLNDTEFIVLQRIVRKVAAAVAAVVPTGRMYCLSLGSRQGNARLHWHIAPLPLACPAGSSNTTPSCQRTAY